ncbi:MAG: hypothetical protein R6W67_09010 [Bacteroidales bacterium]
MSLENPRELGREPAAVSVMESADLRVGNHIADLGRFNRPRIRAVVLQRAVRPRGVVELHMWRISFRTDGSILGRLPLDHHQLLAERDVLEREIPPTPQRRREAPHRDT